MMNKLNAYEQAREETRQGILTPLRHKDYSQEALEDLSQICVGLVEEGILMAQRGTPREEIDRAQWLAEYLCQCVRSGYETYIDRFGNQRE